MCSPIAADLIGQIGKLDATPRIGKRQKRLRDGDKLSPVTGPCVGQESLAGLRAESELSRRQQGLKEFINAPLDLGLFAQCWQNHDEMLQAVVQIGSETSFGSHRLEVSMRGAHQYEIHDLLAATAKRLDFVILQNPKESCLQLASFGSPTIGLPRWDHSLIEPG